MFPYKILGPAVKIVADAAIATSIVGHGRFVPLVILDTSTRPEIAELIELHESVPPGDVVSAWGALYDTPKHHMALLLQFLRPMEIGFAIDFDLSRQGSVAELALRSKAIYLQGGKPGDRLSQNFESSRMIAELNGELSSRKWTELWTKAIRAKLRAKGMTRRAAGVSASKYIAQMREQFSTPIPFGNETLFDSDRSMTDDTENAAV